MGADREIDYPEGLLLYHREGVSLKIIFEKDYVVDDELKDSVLDKVYAVPGSAFIVNLDGKPSLIPWKDYPLELSLTDCRVVPYNLLEIYKKIAGV